MLSAAATSPFQDVQEPEALLLIADSFWYLLRNMLGYFFLQTAARRADSLHTM